MKLLCLKMAKGQDWILIEKKGGSGKDSGKSQRKVLGKIGRDQRKDQGRERLK